MFGRYHVGMSFDQIRDGLSNTIMIGETLPKQCAYDGAYNMNTPCSAPPSRSTSLKGLGRPGLGLVFASAVSRACTRAGQVSSWATAASTFSRRLSDYGLYNALGTRGGRRSGHTAMNNDGFRRREKSVLPTQYGSHLLAA